MMDLDKFKKVNDQFGHEEGNRMLEKTASIIKSIIPEDSYEFRFGRDESGVSFMNRSVQEARTLAEELVKKSAAFQNGRVNGICLSAGLVDTKEVPVDKLMREAGRLLYRSKNKGH
ncbi:GGDEF domain-containing protein [Domibacillus sp. A3M-37]|uniref:GGDEF domain-containing protein n=1 Tax=Domibacillus sp. A3M-37 TaxID=2962037 RepID=UPI0020B839D6|nr:GGDEF domain-containing protein [Domibacillus sp. A3M-37]MCP3762180.1 GGDEF domain-containing protein [Domibacillus sp. A3M-37]